MVGKTTNTTPLEMLAYRGDYDGVNPPAYNLGFTPLNSNYTAYIKLIVTARRTDADGENAVFEISAVAIKNATAGSMSVVNISKVVHLETLTGCTVALTADTTSGYPKLTVTGVASKTISWGATAEITVNKE